MIEQESRRESAGDRKTSEFVLRLYVAGQTPRSIAALTNLERICEEHLRGRYSIEVIDLLLNPQLAEGEQIVALPTLVRGLPEPIRQIIGDLSNTERVLVGLDVRRPETVKADRGTGARSRASSMSG